MSAGAACCKDVSADMGPSALLDLGGIQIVVITIAASAWTRGSSRCSASTSPRRASSWSRAAAISAAASTSSSSPDQIYEVDCPGLTSPVLANFTWTKLPRPVYPLDDETTWTPPS